MNTVKVLPGAAVLALVTWLGFPTVGPVVVGLGIGLLWPRRAASNAALAGLVGWGALLVFALARGDALPRLAARLGGAMGIPPVALPVATLVYPMILAAATAWLAALVSPRRVPESLY